MQKSESSQNSCCCLGSYYSRLGRNCLAGACRLRPDAVVQRSDHRSRTRGMRTPQALLGAALISCAAAMAPTTIRSATPKYAPMPAMLTSTIPGTWAHDTMSRRVVEDILDKVRPRRPVV